MPSGDHQNPTTWPSSSVRTLPAASSTRSGPNGKVYATGCGSVGPMEATRSPTGAKVTAAEPNTGIVRSVEPSRAASTTLDWSVEPARM